MKKFILEKIDDALDVIEDLMMDFMFAFPRFPLWISIVLLLFSIFVLYTKSSK